MNEKIKSNQCPKCGVRSLSGWSDMTREEKIIAEKLPASAEYTLAERMNHRFCTRCWFEDVEVSPMTV